MPRSLTRISLALCLLVASEVWALGLGEVRLDSALNEPLRADIELLAGSPEELENLQVALASAETFNRYGIDRPFYLQNLTFEVIRTGRADGNVVRVRSQAPMTEPFLTFLVEATWSNGRLLREYTVLLDPPTFAPRPETPAQPQVTAPVRTAPADSGRIERAPEPAPVTQAPTQAPAASRPAPSQPATTSSEPKPQPPRDTTPYDATTGDDYSVARGETLWGIASSIRPDSRLTMNQTMLAIYEANPDAFGGNINVLRAGARLRIPSADEIHRIDRSAAFNEAQRQNAAWGGRSATTPAPTSTAPPEPESRPSLTLVPPDDEPADPGLGADTGIVPDEIDEEPLSREEEIEGRIAELEAEIAEQPGLVSIHDNELANLRRELAEMRGEVYEPPVDDVVDEPFVDDEILGEDTPAEPADDALFPEFDEDAAADEAEAADDVATEPSTTIRSRTPREESWLDKIIGLATNLWVGLGVALLLVVGILVWFMRRGGGGDEPDAWSSRLDADDDAPDESLSGTESLRAPNRNDESIVVVEQSGRFKTSGDTVESEAPSFADTGDETGTFGSLEDTFSSETAVNLDQSDPIAEADFHMAYGLYDQAADLINGALQAEPERQDLLTKLCEIYFVWGNRDAFVDAADRLHGVTGDQSDDWDKIVIMGQQIAPDAALFAGVEVAGATKAIDLAFDDDTDGGTGALDMDFGTDGGGDDEVIDLGGDDDDGIDFLFDETSETASRTGTEKTVEMPSQDPTVESPTIADEFAGLEGTSELPSLDEKLGHAIGSSGQSADATAEINLDDLGLDVDSLAETELASLDDLDDLDDDDDATELASLDDLEATGTNEMLDEPEITGKNPQVDVDETGLMEAFDVDDDFARSRTGMRFAVDETGQNPAMESAEETDTNIDEDLLAATGRTQILSEDFAVETMSDEKKADLGDDDATLLASSLTDEDFDYAKTEALPADAYDADETAETPALGSTDVDLDLDDLTSALKLSEKGDTVEQLRDDATVEQPRPGVDDDDTVETLAFAPDDLSDDLNDARTMTEVGTKLDLARAYVDMGDPAGARSILEEVLDEGDEGQRQQAQKLLDSLPS